MDSAAKPSPPTSLNGSTRDSDALSSTVQAPYYLDDHVTIYNADSTRLDFVPDGSVQLVVTSPPYNLVQDQATCSGITR